jgi:hypothetical protein
LQPSYGLIPHPGSPTDSKTKVKLCEPSDPEGTIAAAIIIIIIIIIIITITLWN